MQKIHAGAALSSILAIVVTGSLVALGQSGLVTVLPLIPILGLSWLLQRYPRKAVGYAPGNGRGYLLGLLHPLLVIGILIAVSFGCGWVDTSKTEWNSVATNAVVTFVITLMLALITEEGFFRGWLWASLKAGGWSKPVVLGATSLVFALWHLPEVTISREYSLQGAAVLVLFLNAIVIGSIWGIARDISQSVLVSSFAHALWNTLAYVLFGDGHEAGALGVASTTLVGPEHGFLGLGLNILVLGFLWTRWNKTWV